MLQKLHYFGDSEKIFVREKTFSIGFFLTGFIKLLKNLVLKWTILVICHRNGVRSVNPQIFRIRFIYYRRINKTNEVYAERAVRQKDKVT